MKTTFPDRLETFHDRNEFINLLVEQTFNKHGLLRCHSREDARQAAWARLLDVAERKTTARAYLSRCVAGAIVESIQHGDQQRVYARNRGVAFDFVPEGDNAMSRRAGIGFAPRDDVAFESLIAPLDPTARTVVSLRINCDAPFKEIGKAINRGETVVADMFRAALAKLRDLYREGVSA